MRVVSMRGIVLDMGKLLAENEKQVAIGNANMNARGDILGANGQVIQKKEDVAAEYHRASPKAVKKVSIRDLSSEVLQTPADAIKDAMNMVAKKTNRKIVDSDQ